MAKYQVVIIEMETDEIVERFEPCATEREAERLEDGVNINLNHDEFMTQIEEV